MTVQELKKLERSLPPVNKRAFLALDYNSWIDVTFANKIIEAFGLKPRMVDISQIEEREVIVKTVDAMKKIDLDACPPIILVSNEEDLSAMREAVKERFTVSDDEFSKEIAYFIADGYHRTYKACMEGRTQISAFVLTGLLKDAVSQSFDPETGEREEKNPIRNNSMPMTKRPVRTGIDYAYNRKHGVSAKRIPFSKSADAALIAECRAAGIMLAED